jgi:hypothetical protein
LASIEFWQLGILTAYLRANESMELIFHDDTDIPSLTVIDVPAASEFSGRGRVIVRTCGISGQLSTARDQSSSLWEVSSNE